MARRLAFCLLCTLAPLSAVAVTQQLVDSARGRKIPIDVSYPSTTSSCSEEARCPVALISAGYQVSHTHYQFLARMLNGLGYLAVAIGHELPGDPPLAISGNLFETRQENWWRGAQTLQVVMETLAEQMPAYDFARPVLIGHSNGGDIVSWFVNNRLEVTGTMITLDHRRVPLPTVSGMSVLSLRAEDFEADPGVLPETGESGAENICVARIPSARHNDMSDLGPLRLKLQIQQAIAAFLAGGDCDDVKLAALRPRAS